MSAEEISFDEVLGILKKVEIFMNLPARVVEELGEKMILSHQHAGEKIINQGDKGSSMYIILKGKVKVHDKEYVIANLPEGSFFGEFSLLDDEPRSLSVSTLEPAVTGKINQEDFYAIINKYPEVTKSIIRVMLKRLRNQNQQIILQLRQKQMELEKLVEERTVDLRQKNEDLERTLHELKRTQEQLIQQEKLASLGQITAGIAHEIQNPLNFINNFSSISKDMMEEIVNAKNPEEQGEIIGDLKMNLSKIEEHGKRADRIVKGMLMHTRSVKGEKQMTDLAALCDQSLQLAFNSLNENYQAMNVDVIKNYSPGLPEIRLIPQDLSRVLINIFNNSYYALLEKCKKTDKAFRPSLQIDIGVKTGEVFIRVRDNATGIPEANKSKIFQPFFTTKPTGQGTGLGLSTGYEIIKAHGGVIKFASAENEFTEFEITFPVN